MVWRKGGGACLSWLFGNGCRLESERVGDACVPRLPRKTALLLAEGDLR